MTACRTDFRRLTRSCTDMVWILGEPEPHRELCLTLGQYPNMRAIVCGVPRATRGELTEEFDSPVASSILAIRRTQFGGLPQRLRHQARTAWLAAALRANRSVMHRSTQVRQQNRVPASGGSLVTDLASSSGRNDLTRWSDRELPRALLWRRSAGAGRLPTKRSTAGTANGC